MRVAAPAKINWFLELLDRRPDGYHGIETILQAVGLYDELTVEPAEATTVTVEGWPPDAGPLPEDNLVTRAAALLAPEAGARGGPSDPGAAFHLVKRIPVGAGLGGGSADAAAALVALNRLWGLGLSLKDMERHAAALGSDVPFFLTGGTALCTGRGEICRQLPSAAGAWLVLVKPPGPVSTGWAYAQWDALAAPRAGRRDSRPLITALCDFNPPSGAESNWSILADALEPHLFNALERAVLPPRPDIEEAKAALLAAGARGALLCGSGSAVFGVAGSAADARTMAEIIAADHPGWFVAAAPTLAEGVQCVD